VDDRKKKDEGTPKQSGVGGGELWVVRSIKVLAVRGGGGLGVNRNGVHRGRSGGKEKGSKKGRKKRAGSAKTQTDGGGDIKNGDGGNASIT